MVDPVLLARYRALLEQQRLLTARALAEIWAGLPSYKVPAEFAEAALPILNGAKAATVHTSSAFYSAALRLPTVGVDPGSVAVSPKLRDPYTATWRALKLGRGYDEAVRVGASTVDAMSSSFLQSTARRTGDNVAAQSKRRVRWRRVASLGACDWCQQRSGGIYLSAAEGDYGHDRCHCNVVPET